MCLCKFGHNPLIGSGDRMQTMSIADANVIRTKSNMSPPPPLPFGCGDINRNLHAITEFIKLIGETDEKLEASLNKFNNTWALK